MKKALTSAIAAAVICSAASAFAASFPVPLVLDTAASTVTVTLKLPPTTKSPASVKLEFDSGAWDVELEETGSAPPAQSLTSIAGSMYAKNALYNVKLLGFNATIKAEDLLLEAFGGGPFLNVAPNATGGTIDLAGLQMGLTYGKFEFNIPLLKQSGSFDFDATPVPVMIDLLDEEGNPVLDEEGNPIKVQKEDDEGNLVFEPKGDPLYFELPEGSLATIEETGGPALYNATLTIPFYLEELIEDAIGTDDLLVSIAGVLVFKGVRAVPEPGGVALLGMGLLGVGVPALRRYRRR